jgi:AcrR family transcriptional regulator
VATKRSDAQLNREHLVKVARTLARKGELPAFNELAKAAKVGVGTVYRHFPDQKALLTAIAEDDLSAFRGELEAAAAKEDPTEAVEASLRGAVHMVLARPNVATLLATNPREFKALSGIVEKVVERARKARVLKVDLDANDFRRLVCGIEYAARAGDKPAEAGERYLSLILAGLRASPK